MNLTSDQKLHAMRLIADDNYQLAIEFLVDRTKAVANNMAPATAAQWLLWNGGFKIEAIKYYREHFSVNGVKPGLKDTKDLFEKGQ